MLPYYEYINRLRSKYFLQHADLRALIEPLPRQSHHERLQLLMR